MAITVALNSLLAVLAALFAGLTVYTAVPLVRRRFAPRPERLLDEFVGRTEEGDTFVERLGNWAMRRWRMPSWLDVRQDLRLLRAAGAASTTPARVVGQVLVLGTVGAGQFLLFARNTGGLLIALGLAFLPVFLVRNRANQVRRTIRRSLPDMATIMQAEIAAGNPPDRALERAVEVGGPLGYILRQAVERARLAGRPLFSRGRVRGVLVEELAGWGLEELMAFAAQVDLAASRGAAGPELMEAVGKALVVEYQDRVQRVAESLDQRLLIPTVLFIFAPAMAIIVVPIFLSSLRILFS